MKVDLGVILAVTINCKSTLYVVSSHQCDTRWRWYVQQLSRWYSRWPLWLILYGQWTHSHVTIKPWCKNASQNRTLYILNAVSCNRYLFQSCFICKIIEFSMTVNMRYVSLHFWEKCFLLASLSRSNFTFSLGSSVCWVVSCLNTVLLNVSG